MFGVVVVTFLLYHTLPGDPVNMMAGNSSSMETRQHMREELGLDQPLLQQFVIYINDLSVVSVHANTEENKSKYDYWLLLPLGEHALTLKSPYLRRSFRSNKRVDDILLEHLPGTLWLTLVSIVFAAIVGIVIGGIAALNYGSYIDNFLMSSSVLGISTPSFVSAIVISITFGYYLSDYTHLNMTGSLWETDPIYGRQLQLKNIILPALTLGIRPLTIIAQLTRNAMLDVLSQDYILTAKAKGLPPFTIIVKHALKNALNPVVTAISGWMASLITGAFFVEYIFKWKGIGMKTIQAVEYLDLPIIIGATLMISGIFVLINLFVDILYAGLDPRIRLN
ncbi:ABC transporter permease subunit [Algivirga pacifica]|uniref:ABC transporter permease subunit n=2 Tax=Algivirga pacifica TaxID=1162670 RepID=A0ABP9DAY5_9BACT